jgi:hypothetical protein
MFGSNAGLIRAAIGDHDAELDDVQPESYTDEDSDPYGLELEDDDDAGGAGPSARQHEEYVPQGVRQRMDDQGVYICQLEDSNRNMQERIYLLEQQLKAAELRASGGRADADGSESEGGLAGASDDADN